MNNGSRRTSSRWEGAGSRTSHEPEDLPGELRDMPSWAGELARMNCGSNPQGLSRPWGFFLGSRVFHIGRGIGFLLGAVLLFTIWPVPASPDTEMSNMKRRQQGILTGMPFMAHEIGRAHV